MSPGQDPVPGPAEQRVQHQVPGMWPQQVSRSQSPGLEVVASQPANADQEKAYSVTQNLFQAHPEIKAVFACNDVMALGALRALQSMGRQDVKVVGFDASEDARNAIKNGTMLASVAQYPGEMGRLGVVNAVKLLGGEKIPALVPTKVEVVDQ